MEENNKTYFNLIKFMYTEISHTKKNYSNILMKGKFMFSWVPICNIYHDLATINKMHIHNTVYGELTKITILRIIKKYPHCTWSTSTIGSYEVM